MLQILLKITLVIFMIGNMLDMGLRLKLGAALDGLRNRRFITLGLLLGFVLCPALGLYAHQDRPARPAVRRRPHPGGNDPLRPVSHPDGGKSTRGLWLRGGVDVAGRRGHGDSRRCSPWRTSISAQSSWLYWACPCRSSSPCWQRAISLGAPVMIWSSDNRRDSTKTRKPVQV